MGLAIQGEGANPAEAAQAARDFLDMLQRCSGLMLEMDAQGNVTQTGTLVNQPAGSEASAQAIRDMLASGRKLTIKVRRAPRPGDPIVDSFCQRRVILGHLDGFPPAPPAGHPSATTRCEVLTHVLCEYAHALKAGRVACEEGFNDAHKAGLEGQKACRRGRGQEAPPHHNIQKPGSNTIEFEHCDGSKTTATQDPATGRVTVEHTPAPPSKKKSPPRIGKLPHPPVEKLFREHPVVFVGTIRELGKPPKAWSNLGKAHQTVAYGDVAFLKGGLPGTAALAHHICLEKGLTARAGRPGLSERLFAPGRRVVVFAEFATDPERKGGFRLEANDPGAFVPAWPGLSVAGASSPRDGRPRGRGARRA